MRKKKGAIELGMNTIIIVVIGITLLSLALVWIKNMMGESGIGGITKSAFGSAQSAISDIYQGSTETLSIVPVTLEIKKGGSGTAKVDIRNFQDTDYTNLKLSMTEASQDKAKVSCTFSENFKDTITKSISSGKGTSIPISIKDIGTATGTASCTVSADQVDSTATVIITVAP